MRRQNTGTTSRRINLQMLKKIFFILLLLFVILILAIALIGPRLINSDKIKNKLRDTIQEKYQYDVEIDSLRLSFLFGVKARIEGIHAKSLAGDKYGLDVKAKAFSASIKFIPLLLRKIEIGHILIEDGRIKVSSQTLLSEKISDVEFIDINLFAAPLAINRVIDVKLRGRLAVTPVSGKGPFLRPVEISLNQKIKIEEQSIDIKKLKLDIESLSLSLSGKFSDFKNPVIDAKLSTGDIELGSLKDFLNFGAGTSMSGSLKFDGALSGPLNKYSEDNLKGLLEFKNAEFKGLFPNSVCKLNGRLDLVSSSVLKELLSNNLDNAKIKGNLSLRDGSFNKIAFQDLFAELKLKDNIIDLAPVKFSLYDGGFKGVIRAGLSEEPDFNFNAEVKDVSIEKFLKDTGGMKNTLSGKIYSRLEVAGKGKDFSGITQSMKGKMHVEMKDGKIATLNLLRDILSVAGLLTGMRPPEGDYTRVDVLTADLVIAEGKASTDNLHLFSKGMQVVGKGHFSFDQSLHFIMDAYLGSPREGYEGSGGFLGKYMKDKFGRLVVPIKITGKVTRPRVSLDTERLTAGIINQELKDVLPQELIDIIPKIFK